MTQSEKILERLKEAGEKGVTNLQLNRIAFRYAARLHDLRKDGYQISTVHLHDSVYKFVLHPQKAPNLNNGVLYI